MRRLLFPRSREVDRDPIFRQRVYTVRKGRKTSNSGYSTARELVSGVQEGTGAKNREQKMAPQNQCPCWLAKCPSSRKDPAVPAVRTEIWPKSVIIGFL